MSKVRVEVGLARGQFDQFMKFHIEMNLSSKKNKKILKFREKIQEHF